MKLRHIYLLVSSLTAFSFNQIALSHGHYHHHHHCNSVSGNGLINGLVALTYSGGALSTSSEAIATHDHHHYHHHHHGTCWKKTARKVLTDIKIFQEKGEISIQLKNILENLEQVKEIESKEEKMNVIEQALNLALEADENDNESDNENNK